MHETVLPFIDWLLIISSVGCTTHVQVENVQEDDPVPVLNVYITREFKNLYCCSRLDG